MTSSQLLTNITIQDKPKKAIKIGPSRGFARHKMAEFFKSPLYFVKNGQLELIKLDGFTTIEENVYLYFTFDQELTPLGPKLELEETTQATIAYLAAVKIAMEQVSEPQYVPLAFLSFACADGFVFLSGQLQDAVLSLAHDDIRSLAESSINIGTRAEVYRNFIIASSFYYLMTGQKAFGDSPKAPLAWRKTRGIFTPFSEQGLDIGKDLSMFVESLFNQKESQTAPWVAQKLIDLLRISPIKKIDPSESPQAKNYDKKKKNLERSVWWTQKRGIFGIIALVGFVFLLIPINLLVKALEPPKTLNMDPQTVVMNFYKALSEGDDEYFKDAIAPNYSIGLTEESSGKALNARIRFGTERRQFQYSPNEYFANPENAKREKEVDLFGINKPSLKSLNFVDPKTCALVVEGDWYDTYRQRASEGDNYSSPKPRKIRDEYKLLFNEKVWQISSFVRRFID